MTLGKWTYGAEIEWIDTDRSIPVPEWCGAWDPKDVTLVNSNGKANDPTLETCGLGGEINTKPTVTIEGQVEIFTHLKELLNPNINYRCNLHVHVGIEGLKEDLDSLKKLFQYTLDNQDYVFDEMLFYPRPTAEEFPDPEDFKLAKSFYRQQKYWAKARVPNTRVPGIMSANSPKEFYDGHFHWNEEQQRRQYSIAIVRAGINIRSLFKHNTVEFRIFTASTNPDQLRDCLQFAHEYMDAALNNPTRTAKDIYESREWNFPEWQEFLPRLEESYKSSKSAFPMEYPDPNESVRRRKAEALAKKQLEEQE